VSERIVLAARKWIGTPYRHQASTIGAGTDCLGLIRGVWRSEVGAEPVEVPGYTSDWSEPSQQEVLWETAREFLIPVSRDERVAPGQILLFRMHKGCVAKHLGIVAQRAGHLTFIHAYSGRAVVESALSDPWKRRVVARFRFPEAKS